jgi:hypothetical protein
MFWPQLRDWVIRDLGYITLESFRQLQARGAFFVGRLWLGRRRVAGGRPSA